MLVVRVTSYDLLLGASAASMSLVTSCSDSERIPPLQSPQAHGSKLGAHGDSTGIEFREQAPNDAVAALMDRELYEAAGRIGVEELHAADLNGFVVDLDALLKPL